MVSLCPAPGIQSGLQKHEAHSKRNAGKSLFELNEGGETRSTRSAAVMHGCIISPALGHRRCTVMKPLPVPASNNFVFQSMNDTDLIKDVDRRSSYQQIIQTKQRYQCNNCPYRNTKTTGLETTPGRNEQHPITRHTGTETLPTGATIRLTVSSLRSESQAQRNDGKEQHTRGPNTTCIPDATPLCTTTPATGKRAPRKQLEKKDNETDRGKRSVRDTVGATHNRRHGQILSRCGSEKLNNETRN